MRPSKWPMVTTRGLPLQRRSAPQTKGVNSAQLGLLPRLPDTTDELKSIALALAGRSREGAQPRQGGERSTR